MADWIDDYILYTEYTQAPLIFRKWAAITAIAGALDRRVWTNVGLGPCYPNLYTFLTGVPGQGKTKGISPVKELWRKTKNLHVAPDNTTREGLLDFISRKGRFLLDERVPDGMLEIHSALVASTELGVFIAKHDLGFLSLLNSVWDSPPRHSEERRTVENVDITNPQVTMLAGTQPDFLGAILPEESWGMGFCCRIMFIFSDTSPKFTLFNGAHILDAKVTSLGTLMESFTDLYGEVGWSEAARAEMLRWYEAGMSPVPSHQKLEHYVTKRIEHFLKIVTVAAISRGSMEIVPQDFDRAVSWLLEAERAMPAMFDQMTVKSDIDTLSDMHRFVWNSWDKAEVPVPDEEIYYFMRDKTPSERIVKLIEVAEKAGMIVKDAKTSGWIPRRR